jgi:hypothetical protein
LSIAERLRELTLLCDHWCVLTTRRLDFRRCDVQLQSQQRETCDRGNGAAHPLVRLVAPPRGADAAAPLPGIGQRPCRADVRGLHEHRRSLRAAAHVFAVAYETGGHLAHLGNGGGLHAEGEEIEVFECAFDEALTMVASGEMVDAKTIMLLANGVLQMFAP